MKTIEQQNIQRRREVLEAVSQPGGATAGTLAKRFHVTRGRIISDIRDLRAIGHCIEASSMKMQDGMYQAVFELRTLTH